MGLASYELYQMQYSQKTEDWIFQRLSKLREMGYFPTVLDYKLVFAKSLTNGVVPVPKTLYGQLVDFARETHSFRGVGTSDVLVLRLETGITCFFLEGGDLIPFEGFFGTAEGETQPLTPETEHYVIPGQPDTWRVIEDRNVDGALFFLMENEKQGANTNWIVLDRQGHIVDVHNNTSLEGDILNKLARYVQAGREPTLPQSNEQAEQQERRKLEARKKRHENEKQSREASAEAVDEQNCNMIDGIPNNAKKKHRRRRSVRARLREKQQLLHGGQTEKNRVLEHH